jgi:beta-phosphoglucomutase
MSQKNSSRLPLPGLLFDMDGVLIDSREFHWQSWQILQKEEPRLTFTHETFLAGFGMTNEGILKKMLPETTPEERQKLADKKEAHFRELCQGKLTLLPGMESFLQDVQKHNIPRIIASSAPKKNLNFFLENTALSQYFDSFVSGEEVEHGKPAPDVFLKAASRLQLSPNQCIVLEDSPSGLAAGRAAGCFVAAFATTNAIPHLIPCDILYSSPKDLHLSELIRSWNEWKA